MFVLYADELGHDGVFDPADAKRSHHPLFGLSGFVLRAQHWRDLDRRYLRLKERFYPVEIRRSGGRKERFEPKDLDVRSRRDKQFTHAVFKLLSDIDAVVIAYGIKKAIAAQHNSTALYGSVTQGLMRACEKVVRAQSGTRTKVMMVIDRRQERRDVEVLASAQSYLFSAASDIAGGFDRLIESPMLVRSEWHHGIQIADNICRVIGRVFRFRTAAATEHRWQAFDAEFGAEIDQLTRRLPDGWASVYVRQ